jgi:DNA-binding MarR family transcriptional regulator
MMKPGDLNHLFIATSHLHFRRTHTRFTEYGLGEGQPRVLWQLSKGDGISQAELGRRCNLEPATVTVTLGRMEKSGFVERLPDEHDLRITRVWLTDAGRRMQIDVERMHLEVENECFAGFGPGEKEQMKGFLERMRTNMKQAESGCAGTGECDNK